MDGSEDDSASRGQLLLSQLDLIFLSDPLIDELGFVHPSELTVLHSSDDFHSSDVLAISDLPLSSLDIKMPLGLTPLSKGEDESHAHADCSQKSEHRMDALDDQGTAFQEGKGDDGLPYDSTAFWCRDHKLAISILALGPMYKGAKDSFMLTHTNYKKLLQAEKGRGLAENQATVGCCGSTDKDKEGVKTAAEKVCLEDSLMSYSRALVLINCDHATAWNARKQIIFSRTSNQEVLSRELQMSGVVLSCGPKSEEAWAHRRWVITQMITCGVSRAELDSLLENESKLVEAVAVRSPMNYRAWRHRCWLVSQMSFLQVAIELHRTKLWATSHVSDNCCFHYRRSLLLQLIKSKIQKSDEVSLSTVTAVEKELNIRSLRVALLDGNETRVLWKEEMDWIKNLIQQYRGREALWIHLRFLFFGWVHHISPCWSCTRWTVPSVACKSVSSDAKEVLLLMGGEQHFVDSCISTCSSELTEEGDRQREFAATYKLWVLMMGSKQQKDHGKNGCTKTEKEFNSLELLLNDAVPHRKQLWDGLLPQCQLHNNIDPSYPSDSYL